MGAELFGKKEVYYHAHWRKYIIGVINENN